MEEGELPRAISEHERAARDQRSGRGVVDALHHGPCGEHGGGLAGIDHPRILDQVLHVGRMVGHARDDLLLVVHAVGTREHAPGVVGHVSPEELDVVLSDRGDELREPSEQHTFARALGEPIEQRRPVVVGAARAVKGEAPMLDDHTRAAIGRLEPHFDLGVTAVAEREPRPWLPDEDAPDLDRLGHVATGEREHAAAHAGLELQRLGGPPPRRDLLGEHLEGGRWVDGDLDDRRRDITAHLARFRVRSACALNDPSCSDQNAST